MVVPIQEITMVMLMAIITLEIKMVLTMDLKIVVMSTEITMGMEILEI
mgnify:CR=1 FL=1